MSTSESSAIITRRPLHRRYFSYSESNPPSPYLENTFHSLTPPQNESDHHPLGRTGHPHDGTVTRPRLARVIGDSFKHEVDGPRTQDKGKMKDTFSDNQESGPHKTVIVHEIGPTDSLAGVALKYGISVAELRRANQLWFTDSIHLRKVLYIPLEQSMKHSMKPLIDLLESTEANGLPSLESKNSTIKRIPASQLSFFPSPSSFATTPSPSGPAPKYQPKHTRYATTDVDSSPSALSGLLNSLPIVTRLSLDSSTSSDDAEVELSVVKRQESSSEDMSRHRHHTTTPYRRRDDDLPPKKRPPIPSAALFRTAQLAPQPDMHLPLVPKPHSKSLKVKPSHTDTEVLLS